MKIFPCVPGAEAEAGASAPVICLKRLDRIAGLDNFCWPDPVQSDKTPDGEYKLAQLVRCGEAL
jgi:phosphoribosylformylglycinamidine synthase